MTIIDLFNKMNRRPLKCCHKPPHLSENEELRVNDLYSHQSYACERAMSPVN